MLLIYIYFNWSKTHSTNLAPYASIQIIGDIKPNVPQTISPFLTFLHLHPHNSATFSGSVAAETFQGLKSDPSELFNTLVFPAHPTSCQFTNLVKSTRKHIQNLTAGARLCLTVLGQLLPPPGRSLSPPDGFPCFHSCHPFCPPSASVFLYLAARRVFLFYLFN